MQGPVGPLSKFKNHSLLVALSGGVKELWAFPAILHLSDTWPEACSKIWTLPWNMHSVGGRGPLYLVAVQPSLGRSPLRPARNLADWYSIGSTTGQNPPQLSQTWVLKMYARRPIWMWLSQRALPNPGELSELAQIFNSTNSVGFLSKCDLSIRWNWWLKIHKYW